MPLSETCSKFQKKDRLSYAKMMNNPNDSIYLLLRGKNRMCTQV